MTSRSETVSWSHTPEDSRLLQTLVCASLGIIGGFALGIALGAVGLSVLLVVEGRYALGVGTLLAFVFGLARTAPHLTASTPREETPMLSGLGHRSLAVASVGGLVVLVLGSLFLSSDHATVLFGATTLIPLAFATLLYSKGEIDADAGILTYSGTDIDCSTLVGFRRWAVGGYAIYRLSYAKGTATFGTPRSLVVPRQVDPAVRDALDSGVETDHGDSGPTRRAVRLAAVAGGVFCFGFAGLLLTVDPTGTHPRGETILWYAALVSSMLGVVFVALGIRGG